MYKMYKNQMYKNQIKNRKGSSGQADSYGTVNLPQNKETMQGPRLFCEWPSHRRKNSFNRQSF